MLKARMIALYLIVSATSLGLCLSNHVQAKDNKNTSRPTVTQTQTTVKKGSQGTTGNTKLEGKPTGKPTGGVTSGTPGVDIKF